MSQHKDDITKSTINNQPIHNVIADTADSSSEADKIATAPLGRRRFLQGMAITAASSSSLALVGCKKNRKSTSGHDVSGQHDNDVRFLHGVASGDPLANQVILWTRVTPAKSGQEIDVDWQIATDAKMSNIVNQGKVSTQAKNDFTIKVDADGLQPNTVYYYQFKVGDVSSRVGRTKTLPQGNVDKVKLAVFSCANYPAGYFHAYADAAKQQDVDAFVHLGDYIYEYGRYDTNAQGETKPAYASAHAKTLQREVEPAQEIVSIADYRTRYAQYRTDPDLQELHASIPMIAVWDDHELANDTYIDGAENHQPETEGQWDARKMAAVTAYHEWMPTRNAVASEIYRRFDFGDLLSLYMLDTRVVGRDKQLDYKHYVTINSQTGLVELDGKRFIADVSNPSRQLMGLKQSNWLVEQLRSSKATWQVLGQQVLMGRMLIPAPVILNFVNPAAGVDLPTYLGLAQKAKTAPETLTESEKAILNQPFIPYNLDAWDGYAAARELVLTAARSMQKNLVVLSGDTHNAWANNLTDIQGQSVGVEFATSSVSSPGFEEYLPNVDPALLQGALTQLIKDLQYCDTSQRGYMIVTATAEKCQSEWVFVSDILQQTYSSHVGKTLAVTAGKHTLQ